MGWQRAIPCGSFDNNMVRLAQGNLSHFMNYGKTDTPAERCIFNREICPLSLSWPGEDCEIMIQNSFHLNMPRLSHTYIRHILQRDLRVEENKTSGEA